MKGSNTDSDTCMDIQADVPPDDETAADVALVPQPLGRGRELRPAQDLETTDSIMEFFRLLGGFGGRRHHHRHCPARRSESSVLYLDTPTPETLADSTEPQVVAERGRQSVVWFIPNEPRARVPQDVVARRNSGPGESSSNALRICKRHGHLVEKHSHIPRSHHIHVHRPRGRSCPPDPVGQGHGGGRPPQRPTRIWIPAKRLFRSQRVWYPGRLGMAPSGVVSNPAGEDQIAAALEENARALQSLRIRPEASSEGTSTAAVADHPSST